MLLSSTFKKVIGKKAFDICMNRIFVLDEPFWLKMGQNKFFTGIFREGKFLKFFLVDICPRKF